MRCSPNLALLTALLIAACDTATAQMPDYNNVGRTPRQEEIQAWDMSILPDGKGLPPGSGTAKQGAIIYSQQCVYCHGPTGEEGPAPRLSKDASIVPMATTIWDFINRAMPLDRQGILSADQVYALTAFILYRNGIIAEDAVMDGKSLPKVHMPNRDGFFPPATSSEWKPGVPRLPFGLYQ
jgi:S-disulfanyl-L-cysteine oxidoreductase SoxD